MKKSIWVILFILIIVLFGGYVFYGKVIRPIYLAEKISGFDIPLWVQKEKYEDNWGFDGGEYLIILRLRDVQVAELLNQAHSLKYERLPLPIEYSKSIFFKEVTSNGLFKVSNNGDSICIIDKGSGKLIIYYLYH